MNTLIMGHHAQETVNSAAPQPSVFISYCRVDRESAFSIRRLLEKHGVQVWLDMINITVTSQLEQELYNNIDKHDTFCLLLSPTSVASSWVVKEIKHAKARQGLRFLPVILRSCQIPKELEDVVGLDAREGLEHESVMSRLIRAACNRKVVEDGVLFAQLERDLLARREIIEEAEKHLPAVANLVRTLRSQPIRHIQLDIDVESLPSDSSVLELRLEPGLWTGPLSIFVARYREGSTWADRFKFEELPYTEYYKSTLPRVDARLRWDDFSAKLKPLLHESIYAPASFTFDFDGEERRLGATLSMPTKFEIPCIDNLDKPVRSFTLLIHKPDSEEPAIAGKETDIGLELLTTINKEYPRLYRSKSSYKQEVLLESPTLLNEANLIHREMMLSLYDPELSLPSAMEAYTKSVPDSLQQLVHDKDLELNPFSITSANELRYAADNRYNLAHLVHNRSLYRDAYKMYRESSELLHNLGQREPLSMAEELIKVRSVTNMVQIFFDQEQYKNADAIAAVLQNELSRMVTLRPEEPDYHRYCADFTLQQAAINAKMGKGNEAAKELNDVVEIYTSLFDQLKSSERRLAKVEALTTAINKANLWNLSKHPPVKSWKKALEAEVGKDLTKKSDKCPPGPTAATLAQASKC